MDCNTLERYADLYLDGELAFEERSEVEAHLKDCNDCREAVSHELRFRQGLRESLLSVRAPASLKENVRRRLRRERERLERPRYLPIISSAAAVMLLVILGYGVVYMFDDGSDPTEGAIAAHVAASGSEVHGTPGQVLSFLEKNAPFDYKVPLDDREGVRLIGARVTSLGSTPAIVYLYDIGGKSISVAQYRSAETGRDTDLKVGRRSGYVVATFGDEELTQTVVGDLPEPEVRSFIPASYSSP